MIWPGRTITRGDKDSSLVKQIQIRLNQTGWGPLAEDGVFGEKTFRAVRSFQQGHPGENGKPLTIDGMIGLATWSCLFNDPEAWENTPSPLLHEVLNIARQEIGVKEVPGNSNRGPRVEEYLRSVNMGAENAWCAAFVFWCFRQAALNSGCVNPVVKTASCMNHWANTRGEKILLKVAIQNPQFIIPGCIFIIRLKNGRGHTGIVTGAGNGLIQTIEGNSNASHSAEGDGVYALERKIEVISAGFIIY